MANEVRLIDANALLEEIQFRRPVIDTETKIVADCVAIARRAIVNAPTVDAVPVVRCKNCKHYFHYGDGVYGCRTFGMMKTKPDGFCSYGERREGE